MDPRIQYTKTADGVSIAYATMGEGYPVLFVPPPPWSELSGWELLSYFWGQFAGSYGMLTYDPRGCGFSDRDAMDFSMEAMICDLEAVAAQVWAEPFVLAGVTNATPIVATYAATHPAQVSHVVLCDAWMKFADFAQSPAYEVEVSLRDKNWELLTETFAQVLWRFEDPALARQFAEWIRASCSAEAWRACWTAFESYDASSLLPRVAAPTLILQNRNNRWAPLRVAQHIAATIPGARLAMMDDMMFASLPALIHDFAGDAAAAAPRGGDPSQATAVILFTDIAASTALTQRLGDAGAQELLRTHNAIVRDALKSCSGSEIKHTGDGIMASFASASRALECAIAIQRAVQQQPDSPLRVRVGLNAGEPVVEEQDLFGTAVQLARRICDRAEGGQVLVANVVRELTSGKGFLFSDIGDVALKGFEDPVRLYEVRWREP